MSGASGVKKCGRASTIPLHVSGSPVMVIIERSLLACCTVVTTSPRARLARGMTFAARTPVQPVAV